MKGLDGICLVCARRIVKRRNVGHGHVFLPNGMSLESFSNICLPKGESNGAKTRNVPLAAFEVTNNSRDGVRRNNNEEDAKDDVRHKIFITSLGLKED